MPSLRQVLEKARANHISPAVRKSIFNEVTQAIIADPTRFSALPSIDTRTHHSKGSYVRVYKSKETGAEVIVKDCGIMLKGKVAGYNLPVIEGVDYKNHLRFYSAYRRALKRGAFKPERYVLTRIRPYGVFSISEKSGPKFFLVMEKLNSFSFEQIEEHWHRHGLGQAVWEMEDHLKGIMQSDTTKKLKRPQAGKGTIVLGNTNPEEPEKGKWVVALPHDIG